MSFKKHKSCKSNEGLNTNRSDESHMGNKSYKSDLGDAYDMGYIGSVSHKDIKICMG